MLKLTFNLMRLSIQNYQLKLNSQPNLHYILIFIKQKEESEEEKEESEESEIENDSSDDGPELDWLPDPDKVYGKEDCLSDDGNSSSDESVQTEGHER